MLQSTSAVTPQGLPAFDYRVERQDRWNCSRGQPDKERPANYVQVKYTCSLAPILKLTLLVIKYADVTIEPQWFRTDRNSELRWWPGLHSKKLNWARFIATLKAAQKGCKTQSPIHLLKMWHGSIPHPSIHYCLHCSLKDCLALIQIDSDMPSLLFTERCHLFELNL